MAERGERRRGPNLAQEAGRHLGFGLTWAASTAFFLFLGWLVDRWIGTMPLFLIVGAFVGAGAGFYSLYHHLVVGPREQARREAERKAEARDAGDRRVEGE